MIDFNRKKMIDLWGPEIVVHCCRYWKMHFTDGNFGRCGICRRQPNYTRLKWNEVEQLNRDNNG
jgi:hypothetical protein